VKRWIQLLLLAGLFLSLANSASAQGGFAYGIAWRYTPAGAFPAGGVTVTVCTLGGSGTPCTPTVSLFSDSALSMPVADPLPSCTTSPQFGCIDNLGNFSFYAASGTYTYTITGAGISPYGPIPILTIGAPLTLTAGYNITLTGALPNITVALAQPPIFTVSPIVTIPLQSSIVYTAANGLGGFSMGRSVGNNNAQDFFIYDLSAMGARFTISSAGVVNIPVSLTLGTALAVAQGGTGSTSPALVAGTGISLSGSWPNNTITNTSAYATLADPLPIAHGGTGSTGPGLVAGAGISITGSWPNNTITSTAGAAFPTVVYSTISATATGNLGPTTMFTPTANSDYRATFYVENTAVGVACNTLSQVAITVTWTDPLAAGSTTFGNGSTQGIFADLADGAPFNGVVGPARSFITGLGTSAGNATMLAPSIMVRAKSGQAISYSTFALPSAGCTTNITYQVVPILEQLTAN
jgi:hypothetical protein